MEYSLLKRVHVATVALTFTLFFVRGLWMLGAPQRLQHRWVRVLPHVVDTVLLASGVGLALLIHQYPGTSPWLTAKIVGLVGYIVLGMYALHRGRPRRARAAYWVAALGVAYILAVALAHDPWPPRAWS